MNVDIAQGPVVAITLTVAVTFAFTALITLLSMVRIRGIQIIEIIEPTHRDVLFKGLIVEIFVLCIGTTGIVIKTAITAKSVESKIENLLLDQKAWIKSSLAWMPEPSGLSASGLKDKSNRDLKLVVGVDDDNSSIYVLQAVDETMAVRAVLPLLDKDGDRLSAKDLEAITYDGSKYYYAVSSHRNLAKSSETMLLKFEISPTGWSETNGIKVETTINIVPDLEAFFKSNKDIVEVDFQRWNGKPAKGERQEYAVEIEGMAIRQGKLFFGFKYPLSKRGKALVAEFDLSSQKFETLHEIDMSGYGINDIAYIAETDHMLFAANPPGKPGTKDVDKDKRELYGLSRIYIYKKGSANLIEKERLTWPTKENAKLEGLAYIDGWYWMVFDGDSPYFARRQDSVPSAEAK